MAERTILVIDENEASRSYISNVLREKKFNILEAGSGKEALISAWRDGPDLILFDPALSDIRDVEFVQKLRQHVRTKDTPIIALSSDPSPEKRETCLTAGVNAYIVKSADALKALKETIEEFSKVINERVDASRPRGKGKGSLIVFLSAKGGTGTSSLCANIAMNIKDQQPTARVVVADLVLPIGSIGQIVGYQGNLNLITVADLPSGQTNEEYFINNLPEPDLWEFQLLAGSPDPHHGNSLKGERVGQIVDVLRSVYDFVILDLGRSLSRLSLPLIQQADLISLIVSTDPGTVKLAKTVCDYLQTQKVNLSRVYGVLNHAVGPEGLTKAEAEEIIGFPLKITMPYMGGNFALANNLNQPIVTKYPKDPTAIIMKDVAADFAVLARQFRAS